MTKKLVIALDVPALERARALVEALRPLSVTFKVGYEAYYAFGDAIVAQLSAEGTPYVLDLKLCDIPRTAAAAVKSVVRPGLKIITVHALGGSAMMRAAVAAAADREERPEIFAVTLLTSVGEEDLKELGLKGGAVENVVRLAALARDAGCGGIVCSPKEASDIKSFFGSSLATFCPGIRPAGSAHGDQKRVATPAEALQAGADYVVVGRPVTEAADPLAAARAILEEMSTVGALT
jgi:orotidine-5'-phosphate decarboxylase